MRTKFKPGDLVKMSASYKKRIKKGIPDHLKEFGHCCGIVEGPVDYGSQKGPELDVRWNPSRLRYGYAPKDLCLVDRGPTLAAIIEWLKDRACADLCHGGDYLLFLIMNERKRLPFQKSIIECAAMLQLPDTLESLEVFRKAGIWKDAKDTLWQDWLTSEEEISEMSEAEFKSWIATCMQGITLAKKGEENAKA